MCTLFNSGGEGIRAKKGGRAQNEQTLSTKGKIEELPATSLKHEDNA